MIPDYPLKYLANMRRQTEWSVVGGLAFAPFLADWDDVSCSPLLCLVLRSGLCSAGRYWLRGRPAVPPILLVVWGVSCLLQVPCLLSGLAVSSGHQRFVL